MMRSAWCERCQPIRASQYSPAIRRTCEPGRNWLLKLWMLQTPTGSAITDKLGGEPSQQRAGFKLVNNLVKGGKAKDQ